MEIWVAFAVGFSLASLIFGNVWWQEIQRRKKAERIIFQLQKDLGRILKWE
jgi:uncharacterized membrane protein YciS (DUF1049 family)